METRTIALCAALALAALPRPSLAGENKGIYGTDDRLDFFEAAPAMQTLAGSVVSLWPAEAVSGRLFSSGVNLNTEVLGSAFNLCPGEKFREQPTSAGGICSGSLVGEDLVMTAGHCMKNEAQCKNTKIVFGYAIRNGNAGAATTLPDSEVYDCAGIVQRFDTRELVSYDPANRFYGADFALIRLSRKAAGHRPLAINRGAGLRTGDGVFMLGHPSGLPLKITAGATVKDYSAPGYFKTDLDAFGGNSGSPVFSARTGLLEGILVRGGQDYLNTSQGCARAATFAQTGGREQVTRISVLAEFIPELK